MKGHPSVWCVAVRLIRDVHDVVTSGTVEGVFVCVRACSVCVCEM